jgi:FkbM family methyltransferase
VLGEKRQTLFLRNNGVVMGSKCPTEIIYDFGANNGDDIPYYLKKSDLVVAVEANPHLCRKIKDRFRSELSSGRLILEEKVLAAGSMPSEVAFYIHRTNHVLSQFPPPPALNDFDKVFLPSCSPVDLIRRYGMPLYVKIDVEHYDGEILKALFEAGIRPPFISAESHSSDILALLVEMGGYDAFKLVDGATVSSRYGDALIQCRSGPERYSFPPHSAGPFGDDVRGRWISSAGLRNVLAIEGMGWKDIHASNCRQPNEVPRSTLLGRAVAKAAQHASKKFSSKLRRVRRFIHRPS